MSSAIRSPAEWEVLIDDFLAAGLSQRVFCEQRGISSHAFRNRYQRHEKFAGTRRRKNGEPATGFVPVRPRSAPSATPVHVPGTERAVIRIGTDIIVECPAMIALETIARLAVDARR